MIDEHVETDPHQDQTGRSAQHPLLARERTRFRLRITLPITLVTAAVAAVVILLAVGGTSNGPSLDQAAKPTLASATVPAPAESPNAKTLEISNAGIWFPYWGSSVKWQAIGARTDQIGGRSIVTVFYEDPKGTRVGYSIVDGPPLTVRGGVSYLKYGVTYTFKRLGSAQLVTFLRARHTCVIACHGARPLTLIRLATAT